MNRKARRSMARTAGPAALSPGQAQAVLAEAARNLAADRLQAAEFDCRKVLAQDPDQPDALHLLGVIAARSDRPADAAALIARSLQARPANAQAQNHLGGALQALGRPLEALAACEEAVRLDPGYARAHYNRGVALQALGRNEAAIEAFARAAACDPTLTEAHNSCGHLLAAQGRPVEAEAAYRRAIAAQPAYADPHNNLGALLRTLGRPDEAAECCRRAIALQPGFAEAHNNLGNLHKDAGRYAEAICAYRAALQLKPAFAHAAINLAVALQEHGDAAEALAATDQALAADPVCAHAWYIRAHLKTFTADDPELAAMEVALAAFGEAAEPETRLNLDFALGKAWMDAGVSDRAFAHLESANRLRRAALDYDLAADVARHAAIAQTFTPGLMQRLGGLGDPDDAPVFVVGMPRSGSSLVEQVLASHPKVHGAGELPALKQAMDAAGLAFPRGIEGLTADTVAKLGRAYVDAAARHAPAGRLRVIDKMPGNFHYAGLIRLMLPNARIIHCRRDPADVGLSCYIAKFTQGQPFAFDLRELGLYLRSYQALMAHWRGLLPPDRFIEVDYEAVVDDLEGQARRMIAFCGLDWDPACLSFHRTRRAVQTASVNQVRRPLYRSAVGRWRAHARHLAPLIEGLGEES
jgi:tetratricopeptide (TPR) repeat protein